MDKIFGENNEGTIKMLQDEVKQALLGDDKVLIMGDFKQRETDWEHLDMKRGNVTWRHKFSEYFQENLFY